MKFCWLESALLAVLPLAASAEVKLAAADAMLIEHRFTIAGGCYCERWDGGSAEHGRVVMAMPGK